MVIGQAYIGATLYFHNRFFFSCMGNLHLIFWSSDVWNDMQWQITWQNNNSWDQGKTPYCQPSVRKHLNILSSYFSSASVSFQEINGNLRILIKASISQLIGWTFSLKICWQKDFHCLSTVHEKYRILWNLRTGST